MSAILLNADRTRAEIQREPSNALQVCRANRASWARAGGHVTGSVGRRPAPPRAVATPSRPGWADRTEPSAPDGKLESKVTERRGAAQAEVERYKRTSTTSFGTRPR